MLNVLVVVDSSIMFCFMAVELFTTEFPLLDVLLVVKLDVPVRLVVSVEPDW
jgi:hypothetical protein